MTKSNLKAHQKRAVFKKRFGEILAGHDFRLCGERFIRLHANEVLLQVSMELDVHGNARIRFGGMPLCVEGFDPALAFGEYVCDFAPVHPFPEGRNPEKVSFEDGQFDMQFELFRDSLLAPFAGIRDVRSLLKYQEAVLEKPLGLLPADWACFECLYLEDYESALRYAVLWQGLKEAELDEYRRTAEAEIAARDCTERERKYMRKDMEYRCKCRDRELFAIQRLIYMIETGLHRLIQENLAEYISAAGAAFEQNYPQYRTKE